MPYFTFTRLNLYLDHLILDFNLFKLLEKPIKNRSRLQYLQRNVAKTFAQTPLQGICTILVLLTNKFRFEKFPNTLHTWIFWVKGFSKKCNLLYSAKYMFLGHFLLKKYLDFAITIWIFANFIFSWDYWIVPKGFKKRYQMFIDFYHKKDVEGEGGRFTVTVNGKLPISTFGFMKIFIKWSDPCGYAQKWYHELLNYLAKLIVVDRELNSMNDKIFMIWIIHKAMLNRLCLS